MVIGLKRQFLALFATLFVFSGSVAFRPLSAMQAGGAAAPARTLQEALGDLTRDDVQKFLQWVQQPRSSILDLQGIPAGTTEDAVKKLLTTTFTNELARRNPGGVLTQKNAARCILLYLHAVVFSGVNRGCWSQQYCSQLMLLFLFVAVLDAFVYRFGLELVVQYPAQFIAFAFTLSCQLFALCSGSRQIPIALTPEETAKVQEIVTLVFQAPAGNN